MENRGGRDGFSRDGRAPRAGGRDFQREDRGERGSRRDGNRDERRSEWRKDKPGDRNGHGDARADARSEWRPEHRQDGRPERRERRPDGRHEARSDNRDQGHRSFDRTPRRDDAPRPFRKESSGPRNRDLEAIMALDEELLRMVMRRARMLARQRTAGRLDPALEKALRTSWEEKAARIGRDSRLARDLFQLIQAVEPLSRVEEEQGHFNLAPQPKPVEINLPAPADGMTARMVLALATASGKATAVRGLPLSDGIIDGIKALNQIGGQLWWEEDGSVLSRGGKGLTRNLDKIIHVGDDAFNLWLVIAFCLGMPARLKITGGEALRFIDLSGLRHFLPSLGARLTNVIPAQDGLPVRLECSGILPSEITLPSGLSPRFAAALTLALPFWESRVRLSLPVAPEHRAPAAVEQALALLESCGGLVRVERKPGAVVISPAEGAQTRLPEEYPLPIDALVAAYILAFPAFAGGDARLAGHRPSSPFAEQALTILKECGLSLQCDTDTLHSTRAGAITAPSAATLLATAKRFPDLLPLGVVLSALAARGGKEALLPLAELETLNAGTESLCSGFLARAGFTTSNADGETRIIPLPDEAENDAPRAAWISPSAPWAMALALAAYLKPHIHLANPGVLTGLLPTFWNFYNSLPAPDFKRRAAPEIIDDKPARRRIIAQGGYGALPSEASSGDND